VSCGRGETQRQGGTKAQEGRNDADGPHTHVLAAYMRRWKPYRQFLYDFVVQSEPKLPTLNASQASGILWAYAK